MSSIKTSFSDNSKKVNVTIHKNFLKEENCSFAKVSRNTVNAENLIAVIREMSSTRIDEGYLYYCAKLFKEAILKKLKEGAAVNLFDMGTLYLTANGNINGTNPSSVDIPHLSVGFTPSNEAKEAVKNVEINQTFIADTSPIINTFTDLYTTQSGTQITHSKSMQINGSRLKVAGESSGIFFVPVKDDNSMNENETTWIKVPVISKNLPSELQFFLPEELEIGKKYYIVIRTSSSHGSRLTKKVRIGKSDTPIEIV